MCPSDSSPNFQVLKAPLWWKKSKSGRKILSKKHYDWKLHLLHDLLSVICIHRKANIYQSPIYFSSFSKNQGIRYLSFYETSLENSAEFLWLSFLWGWGWQEWEDRWLLLCDFLLNNTWSFVGRMFLLCNRRSSWCTYWGEG